MDLYEAEGKKLFLMHGLPADHGVLYQPGMDLTQIPYPCVVKAQYLSGKRGKAGGIQFADCPQTLTQQIEKVREVRVNGQTPAGIYITERADIMQEHYISATLDRASKQFLVVYSPDGGMDIEAVSEEQPERVIKFPVGDRFDRHTFVQRVHSLGVNETQSEELGSIAEKLVDFCWEEDATLAEINPLAYLKDGTFAALDAKVTLDDNACYRHPDCRFIPRTKEESEHELTARENGLAYVELGMGGNIGVLAGGAGIGMATVDAISYYGLVPYDFLDLGGGVTSGKMAAAVKLLLSVNEVKAILINVFGGVNNCKTMAEGLCAALEETGVHKPIVVKSRGFNQEEGWALMEAKSIPVVRYGTTDDAVKKLMNIMREDVGV